jgi:hypothetical protein
MQLMNFPLAVVFLLTGAVMLMIGSALVISAMIGEVNRRLPEDQQVSYLLGYPGKLTGIKHEYKRLYPEGNLAKVLSVLWVLIVIMMAACALLIGLASHNL